MATQLVLVTGGSGYIGSYCIVKLLQAGYRVRTTVRSLKRAAEVRAMVKASRLHLLRCCTLTWSLRTRTRAVKSSRALSPTDCSTEARLFSLAMLVLPWS